MRAAVLRAAGEPMRIEDVDLAPVGADQVRVRLAATGVCHSDLSICDGTLPFPLPAVLGHEGAGVVEEVGELVTRVRPGDHVVVVWMPACRECYFCLAGQTYLCERGMGVALGAPYATAGGTPLIRGFGTATFAEETLVVERSVVKVPDDVPLEVAALLGCAISTGTGAALNTARVEPGSTVAVLGCGGVGLAVVMGARVAGAARIIAVDRLASKTDRALGLGATHAVDASTVDAVRAVRDLTDGRGADYTFEVVGRSATIRTAWEMTRRGGTCTVVGAGSHEDPVTFSAMDLFLDAKTMLGCMNGSTDAERDYPRYLELWRAGVLPIEQLVTRHSSLDAVNDALSALAAGDVVRTMLRLA